MGNDGGALYTQSFESFDAYFIWPGVQNVFGPAGRLWAPLALAPARDLMRIKYSTHYSTATNISYAPPRSRAVMEVLISK